MAIDSVDNDIELGRVVSAVKRSNFIVLDPLGGEHQAVQIDGIGLYTRTDMRGVLDTRCLVALQTDPGAGLRAIRLDHDGLPHLEEESCAEPLRTDSSSLFERVEAFNRHSPAEGRHALHVLAVK